MRLTGFEVLDASIQATNRWYKPLPLRSRAEFFSGLSSYLARNGEDGSDAEKVTMALFRFLERKATYGEISDLQHVVPALLIDLWPATLRAA